MSDLIIHAKWIEARKHHWICSCCQNEPLYYMDEPDPVLTRYCPFCGSRMDGFVPILSEVEKHEAD